MSNEAMTWAVKDAPVRSGIERLILLVLGDVADEDGCNAAISQATIAERALIADSRTVRDHLKELEKRGLIARGDQTVVDYLPPGRRPVVYDLMIPYAWFGSTVGRINRFRDTKGRAALTEAERPEIDAPPVRKARSDKGVSRNPDRHPGLSVRGDGAYPGFSVRGDETGTDDIPGGLSVRPDSQSGVKNPTNSNEEGGTPDYQSDNPYVLTTSSKNPPLLVGEVTEGPDSGSSGGGSSEEEDEEEEITIQAVVAWFAASLDRGRLKPLAEQWPTAWTPSVVYETLIRAQAEGHGDLRTVANVLLRLANGEYGECRSPRRMLYSKGSWWASVASQSPAKTDRGVRCSKPAHAALPPAPGGCIACKTEALAADTGEQLSDGGGLADVTRMQRWLPERLKPRTPVDDQPEEVAA